MAPLFFYLGPGQAAEAAADPCYSCHVQKSATGSRAVR